jgi:predicted TIM-barrel fold metal-dependent hydrolase
MLASGEVIPAFEASLDVLAERGLVFDLDCEWQNMAAARALAERHPDLQVVLEHIGFPRSRDDEYFSNWAAAMRLLAGAPNVTCKISGVGMTDPRFTAESLRRWIDTPLEAFGADRCVLGSNWPVDRLYSSYDVIMDIYRDRVSALFGEEDQRKVLSGNAARIYRLA